MIELKNVTKVYDKGTSSETTIFNNFNLKINTGDFISIIGSNGSGKTSLLNCICGNTQLDEGDVIIADKNVTKLKNFQRYRKIGRVYQNPEAGTCPNLTVLENLALADNKGKCFGLKFCINKKRIDFYKEKLAELEMGLEDKLNTKVGSLSGGQKQAIALIMTTLTNIDILILDEHTAALDPKAAEKIMEITNKIIKEKEITAIMITHNLKYALKYGNRLIVMNNGKIKMDLDEEAKKKMTSEDMINIFSKFKMI